MDGWKCPGCGACFAPWMAKCDRCPPQTVTTPGTISVPGFFWPLCVHEWGEPNSAGRQCTKCGAAEPMWEVRFLTGRPIGLGANESA